MKMNEGRIRTDHRMCRRKGKNHVVTKFFTPLRLSLRAMSQFLTDEFYSIPSYIIMISIRIMIAFTDGHRESYISTKVTETT